MLEPAIAECNRARATNPDVAAVQVALGGIYSETGRYEFALEAYGHAIELDPMDPAAHLGLASVYGETGHGAEAESIFRHAIELDPRRGGSYRDFAYFLYRNGRLSEAADQYEHALLYDPEDTRSRSNLGGILFFLGDFERAAVVFAESIERAPYGPAYSNAGTNLYYAGDYQAAYEMFIEAERLLPEHHQVHGNLGDAARQVNASDAEVAYRYERALELADMEVQVNPTDALAHSARALYLARLAQFGDANRAMRRALDLAPHDVDVRWDAGMVLYLQERVDEALSEFRLAYEYGYPIQLLLSEPDLADIRDSLRAIERP